MGLKVVKKGEPKEWKPPPSPAAPKPKLVRAKPDAEVEAIKAQMAQVTTQQAQIKKDRFVMALEKARINPDYHEFAIGKLGDLDLSKKADLAKIDAFAAAHKAMVLAPDAAAPKGKPSVWLDAAKAKKEGTLAAIMPRDVLEQTLANVVVENE